MSPRFTFPLCVCIGALSFVAAAQAQTTGLRVVDSTGKTVGALNIGAYSEQYVLRYVEAVQLWMRFGVNKNGFVNTPGGIALVFESSDC
jgi:hypothetical protein